MFLNKEGQPVCLSLMFSGLGAEEGQAPSYIIVYAEDITELKIAAQETVDHRDQQQQMEEQIRQSERNYRLMSENSLDLISRHAVKDSVFLYCSSASRTLLGYEPEEMVGTSAYNYLHPDDLVMMQGLMEQSRSSGVIPAVAYRYRHKNGTYVWFESSSRYTYDDEGNVLEIIAIGREITERKQFEFKLKESEQRYKSLFEYNPSAVYSMNLHGDYLTANANLEKLTGYSLEELIGMYFGPIVHEKDIEKTLYHFNLAAQVILKAMI